MLNVPKIWDHVIIRQIWLDENHLCNIIFIKKNRNDNATNSKSFNFSIIPACVSHPLLFIFKGRNLIFTHMVNFLMPAEIYNAGQEWKFDVPKFAMYRSFCPKPRLRYIESRLYIIKIKVFLGLNDMIYCLFNLCIYYGNYWLNSLFPSIIILKILEANLIYFPYFF